jgi:hypothetical protein
VFRKREIRELRGRTGKGLARFLAIAKPCVQLAFENQRLVAEHHDLDVLFRLRAPERHDEAEEKREGEGGACPGKASPPAQSGFWHRHFASPREVSIAARGDRCSHATW